MKKPLIALLATAALLTCSLSFTSAANAALDNYPYVKNGEIDLLGYFEMNGATAALKEESIDFTLTSETATVTFAKPLVADGFNFQWNAVEDSAKRLQSLAVTVTDSADAACSLKTTFSRISDVAVGVKINADKRTYMIPGNLHTPSDMNYTLIYGEEDRSLSDSTNYTVFADKCENGNGFGGFRSAAVLLTVTVKGKVGATFSLKSINRQRFGAAFVNDNVDPSVYVPTTLSKALYGSTVTLPKASAYDVLATSSTLKLTVKDPSGEIVTATDGTRLEEVAGDAAYAIKMTAYGAYRVQYVASDGVNTTRSIGYQITVLDSGAPELSLDGKLPRLVKAGETFSLPTASIRDNVSASENCAFWITVKHPSGKITAEKDSFTPPTAGHYQITYSCCDELGNLTRYTHELYAEKGADK